MKKIICLLLCLTMLWICAVCSADSGSLSEADRAALDHLSNELEKSADHLMRKGENSEDIYTTLEWRSLADTFPAKFDLRERGTITPVKDQNPWGTCWSFAAIAASETSILNSLGLTAEEYQKEYGTELDLSEKHLAWFAAHALPEVDEYPDGEYPFDEAQAGEGFHILDSVDKNPLNMGGPFALSNSTLASGVGVLYEEFAPYVNSEGLEEKSGDWSLPEEERFSVSYELKNANILPAPATHDEDGNYVYRSASTEALKTELMAGRAAVIAFLSDDSEPEPTIEELREAFANELNKLNTGTEEEKARFIDIKTGYIDAASRPPSVKPRSAGSQESGVRNQESGVRNQESGVRNQESGVRNQGEGAFSALLQRSALGTVTVPYVRSLPHDRRHKAFRAMSLDKNRNLVL